jgi:hypothetical protein
VRYLFLVLALALPSWAFEGLPSLHVPLTVVVDAERPLPEAALRELQTELAVLMQQAGRPVEWRQLSAMKAGDTAADLVMVKFRGNCRMEAIPALLDERGPLAFTHTMGGEVLPFSEVLCDQVKVAARSAMHGGQLAQGDQLLGRALARVVAHEIWHMTSNQHQHSKTGVARHALSGAQLIGDKLKFDETSAGQLTRKTVR